MGPRLLPGLLAITALGGCAMHMERPAASAMEWVRFKDEQGAGLALGRPNSDLVALRFICRPASGRVELNASALPDEGAVIELHSGKIWNRYLGAGYASEEQPGEVQLQVNLAEVDPVLRTFADTGDLSVVFTGRRLVTPNAFAPAHDFLAVCRLPGR